MRILFIGGTGNISSAATHLAVERGCELYLLNRGLRTDAIPADAKLLKADIKNPEEVSRAIGKLHFDAVVNWIAFTPADISRDLALFRGRTFAEGMRQTLAWFRSDPSRQAVDTELEKDWDEMIAAYETGLQAARDAFGP